jgi:uncharacterized protein (DUF1501 family)
MNKCVTSNASRREFLRQASALSIAGTATPFALNLASIGAASAQVAGGYKALVCVFLYGANDGHNTVVPYDVANYQKYFVGRQDIGWLTSALTPLNTITPLPNGLQLSLPTGPLAPLATLFDQQKCAIVANVGPLIQPTTRTNFQTPGYPLPPKLFSHNDQQSVWQASAPEGATYGWGGRIGDLLASQNGSSIFTCLNVSGNAVFLSGQQVQPFQLDATQGAVGFSALAGGTPTLYGSAAASTALRTVLTRNRTHLFENETVKVNTRSIDANTALAAALAGAPALTPPAGNSLATQLAMVAKVISVRAALGAARQVFLVSMGGYDTHSAQVTTQTNLLSQLASAISFFQSTMDGMGTANDVTLFTASDFGRTLIENGDGSDHGWGSHHFVVGGAVKGKEIYGAFPDLTLNVSTDAGNGRLIPTTSVEQYAATMAKWMGVTDANLPVILPNLINFSQQNLGFMN